METSGSFKIDFREVTNEGLTRTLTLDDSFFSSLDEQEIKHGNLTATLRVKKKAAGFLLEIRANGTVEILCDRCLEPMTQPICAQESIEVRLGESYDDDGERIILPEYEPVLDVAWNIYETIALAIPISHFHPEGSCKEDFSQYLVTDDEPARQDSEGGESTSNDESPWSVLRNLTFGDA